MAVFVASHNLLGFVSHIYALRVSPSRARKIATVFTLAGNNGDNPCNDWHGGR